MSSFAICTRTIPLLELDSRALELKTIALLVVDEGGLQIIQITTELPSAFLRSGIIIKQGYRSV